MVHLKIGLFFCCLFSLPALHARGEMAKEQEIVCLSQMKAKRGSEEILRKALVALIDKTLAESGCIAYELWEVCEESGAFIMYERFVNEEAYEAHVQAEYIQDFIRQEYATCVESSWDLDCLPLQSD